MTKKINYEDDIFTLSLLVRNLSDILKLDIDPEFFSERIDGDIAFIDSAIGRMYEALAGGPLFLKRHEYLKGMQRLKRSFVDMLDAIVEKRLPFAVYLDASAGRFRAMRERHEREIADIRSTLSQSKSPDEEHMVSEDEFKILLSPSEE